MPNKANKELLNFLRHFHRTSSGYLNHDAHDVVTWRNLGHIAIAGLCMGSAFVQSIGSLGFFSSKVGINVAMCLMALMFAAYACMYLKNTFKQIIFENRISPEKDWAQKWLVKDFNTVASHLAKYEQFSSLNTKGQSIEFQVLVEHWVKAYQHRQRLAIIRDLKREITLHSEVIKTRRSVFGLALSSWLFIATFAWLVFAFLLNIKTLMCCSFVVKTIVLFAGCSSAVYRYHMEQRQASRDEHCQLGNNHAGICSRTFKPILSKVLDANRKRFDFKQEWLALAQKMREETSSDALPSDHMIEQLADSLSLMENSVSDVHSILGLKDEDVIEWVNQAHNTKSLQGKTTCNIMLHQVILDDIEQAMVHWKRADFARDIHKKIAILQWQDCLNKLFPDPEKSVNQQTLRQTSLLVASPSASPMLSSYNSSLFPFLPNQVPEQKSYLPDDDVMFVIPPLTLDVDAAFSEMDRRRYMFIRDAWLKFGLYDWSGAVSSHHHNNKHRSANLMNDFIGTHLKLEKPPEALSQRLFARVPADQKDIVPQVGLTPDKDVHGHKDSTSLETISKLIGQYYSVCDLVACFGRKKLQTFDKMNKGFLAQKFSQQQVNWWVYGQVDDSEYWLSSQTSWAFCQHNQLQMNALRTKLSRLTQKYNHSMTDEYMGQLFGWLGALANGITFIPLGFTGMDVLFTQRLGMVVTPSWAWAVLFFLLGFISSYMFTRRKVVDSFVDASADVEYSGRQDASNVNIYSKVIAFVVASTSAVLAFSSGKKLLLSSGPFYQTVLMPVCYLLGYASPVITESSMFVMGVINAGITFIVAFCLYQYVLKCRMKAHTTQNHENAQRLSGQTKWSLSQWGLSLTALLSAMAISGFYICLVAEVFHMPFNWSFFAISIVIMVALCYTNYENFFSGFQELLIDGVHHRFQFNTKGVYVPEVSATPKQSHLMLLGKPPTAPQDSKKIRSATFNHEELLGCHS